MFWQASEVQTARVKALMGLNRSTNQPAGLYSYVYSRFGKNEQTRRKKKGLERATRCPRKKKKNFIDSIFTMVLTG